MGKIVHIVMMVRNEGTSDAKVEEWASEGLKMKGVLLADDIRCDPSSKLCKCD